MFLKEGFFHLEAAVERRNLLREARRSEEGERVASRADSGGSEAFSGSASSSFEDGMLLVVVIESSKGNVNFFLFLLPTRSLNNFRNLSHLVGLENSLFLLNIC